MMLFDQCVLQVSLFVFLYGSLRLVFPGSPTGDISVLLLVAITLVLLRRAMVRQLRMTVTLNIIVAACISSLAYQHSVSLGTAIISNFLLLFSVFAWQLLAYSSALFSSKAFSLNASVAVAIWLFHWFVADSALGTALFATITLAGWMGVKCFILYFKCLAKDLYGAC